MYIRECSTAILVIMFGFITEQESPQNHVDLVATGIRTVIATDVKKST
jgi:hypothetical protein